MAQSVYVKQKIVCTPIKMALYEPKDPSCAKVNFTETDVVDSEHIVSKNLSAHFCGELKHVSVFYVFLLFVALF